MVSTARPSGTTRNAHAGAPAMRTAAVKAAASPATRTAVRDRSLRAAESRRGTKPPVARTDRVPSAVVSEVTRLAMCDAGHAPHRTFVQKPVERFTTFVQIWAWEPPAQRSQSADSLIGDDQGARPLRELRAHAPRDGRALRGRV